MPNPAASLQSFGLVSPGSGMARPKILSLSIEYPNPADPGLGLFVRSRLQHMAALADLKVFAPVSLLSYSDPQRRWLRPGVIPMRRWDERLEVIHPRWVHPPFGTPANILCLFLGAFPHLKRLKRAFDFQIIDAHFGYPDGVAAALAAAVTSVPFFVTLRGNEPMFAESPLRRRCLQWALSRAARVIAVSEKLARFALDLGVAPERVKTIGNGVDTDVFFPRERTACRAQLGLLPDAKVVLCTGALLEAKGHQHVIRAARQLAGEGMDVHMLIAGIATRGGPRFDRVLEQLVADLGLGPRVKLLGWVPPAELPVFLSAADVFCLASDSEGWPNVVHEAQSCGVPVVATRVGAVPDMLPSEQYGLMVDVGDQPALVAALRKALSSPWDRDAIAAWGQARSWKQVAREVIDEVNQVLYVRN
jgi:glycosyltransferase involved in cell wall biosynthesis